MTEEIVEFAAPSLAPSQQILTARGLSVAEVIETVCKRGYKHVVQEDGLNFKQELAASERMIESPEAFFADPARTILGPHERSGRVAFSLELDASEKKHRLLENLTNLLSNVHGAKRVIVQALAIADELYTNASKNSWDVGDQFYATEPRRRGRIEFRAVAEEDRLLLSCRDTFGLLSTPKLLDRLMICSHYGIANSISTNSPGAGIGAFLTFDSSISYYAGVVPGSATVVAATLPLGISGSVYSELAKNIHLVG